MIPRTAAHRTLGALIALAAVAIEPAICHADPLAVLVADPPGGERPPAHPDATERSRLADAVSGVLGRALPDVLSGGESRSRIEVLDPSLLTCTADACAARIATVTHARVVVLVRASVNAATLHLELAAVDPSGHAIAQAADDTALADWDDALALASVLAGRLIPALRPAPTAAVATPTPTPHVPAAPVGETTRSAPRIAEAVVGGALVVGGLALGIASTAIVAQGTQCTSGPLVCNPTGSDPSPPAQYSSPSALSYVGLVGGYAAAIAGAVLLVHGATAREVVPASTVASRRPHGPRVLGVDFTTNGFSVRGAF